MMVAAEEGTGAGALGAVGGGKGGVESGDSAQIEIPFCGCLSVRYYQPVQHVEEILRGLALLICVHASCRRSILT
jgi:adenine deaminase